MTPWVRVVGAALGLLLLAGLFGTAPLLAQTAEPFTPPAECSEPPPPKAEDGMTVQVLSPTGTDPRTSPNVAVEASFANESRRPVVNQYNGQVAKMRAFVLACEPGLVAPTSPDPVTPAGDPRTASFAWSAEFPTNGRFAIILEAEGTSSQPDDTQSARAVASVRLAVPPKKPSNVEVSDPANGVVTVSWDYVDPEPDLFGFEVRRARQGSAEYTTIKNGVVGPRARSVPDSPPVGAWRYHVVAYRQGAPEGAVSRDDTVEVAEAPPPSTTPASGDSTTGSSGGTASGAAGSPTTAGGTPIGSSATPGASLDLSAFAAALNARRNAPVARIEPPDPGFQQTLPFDVPGQLEIEEPEELGADEPNVGVGQRPVSNPGERQRSLGFVAFGLLLFVLSMTGLFLKSEVKRAELVDLDAIDGEAPDLADSLDPADAPAPVIAAAVAARFARRRRTTPAVVAAPDPDPEPEPEPALARRRRSRTAEAPSPDSAGAVAVAERAATAVNGSAIDIPETRNRWSGRVAEPVNGHPAEAPAHDFADLAPEATVSPHRHRPGTRDVPLDAPGLDVPDPARAARRSRAATPSSKATTLPTRPKATSGRR